MLHRFLVQLWPWVSLLAAHYCLCSVILLIYLCASPTLVLHYKTLVVMGKPDNWLWGVDVSVFGRDGKPTFGLDGKVLKMRVPMSNGWLNSAPQLLNFTPNNGSDCPLVFKGMIKILQERRINTARLKRECPGLKCSNLDANCCAQQTLWNKPNFSNTRSLLEEHCEKRHIKVVFLPKFHCKLNFIKQC
jgi:hypothetical protein